MQSPTHSNSGPKPVPTATTEQPLDTECEAQPTQATTDGQEEGNESAATVGTETLVTPQENGTEIQAAETSGTMAGTQAADIDPAGQPMPEPPVNTAKMEMDSPSKPDAPKEPIPDTNANPGCDQQKAKKQDKGGRDGRKYVPSKKAMIDPLKMDMSKALVMPLTSSQLSLQCMDCHIIFSDHKSKERHLKLSHPAEYEQCILRNALFACYVCDRHFTNSTELMVHQKAHTEKKPFKCPICGQAFNKSSELTLHKKVHFGQDGYACTDCGKPCKTMTLLKYHRRTHTGERPYVCKECGKRFTMSKALQKHVLSHSSEGAEGEGDDTTAEAQMKKDNGDPTVKYPCSACKATFKSTKTQLHHIKTKHNVLSAAAGKALQAGLKQSTPIITPISISQPTLLQVEPNGPLQKVDANIDTEQIRRLIETLGNVQKVNQVVILGQVPPHAPPLEVQQLPQLTETMNLNLSPPQIDFIGLKETESKIVELNHLTSTCDPMEQTIILEPITPDGQLENSSFSELGSHMAVGENMELTLVPTEHTETPEGDMMHQILHHPDITTIQSDPVDQMVCQNDEEQNLEQTVILELIPTVELEQSHTVPENEIPSSDLAPITDLEKTSDQTVLDEQEADSLSAPPLMTTVELELTPLQTEQQGLSSCTFVPPDTLTQASNESESNLKGEVESQMHTVSLDEGHPVEDGVAPQETQKKSEQEQLENSLIQSEEGQEQLTLSEVEVLLSKEEGPSQTKQASKTSELPLNVMSAQELVKVRKRKPTRAYIFYDDFQIDAQAAKRQRTKKSHLVVKFGPQSKEKKNKKQKKPSQQRQPTQKQVIRGKTPATNLQVKNIPSQKKGRKGKGDKKAGHSVSSAEIKCSSSTQDSEVQQEDTRKNKMKKQREVTSESVVHKTVASPVFKKKKRTLIKQKVQPKNAKDGKTKKNLAKEENITTKPNPASADTGPHITQDALLLLKGHKQPQLKVHKLDPLKASTHEAQTVSQQSKDIKLKDSTNESSNDLTIEKKKGGRPKKPQKALSLLSSLQVSRQSPETLPAIPKTTRKRKASLKVETEGVITSHSKRALECKDCGERFSEVASLQKHKTTVHIIESPGLTYTNGNIFEGVSQSDLYQLPKQQEKGVSMMNAATDWDTEPEMALEERERSVSFPALIPSPSLPVPPLDVEVSADENKAGNETAAGNESPPEIHPPSDQIKTSETLSSQSPLNAPTERKSLDTGEPLASVEEKQEPTQRNQSLQSEVQVTINEDIKEDLLLEVDLVTVGEQNERDETTSHEDTVSQNGSNVACNSEGRSPDKFHGRVSDEATGNNLTSHTVSCSTHQVEIKEEEEEMLVQKKKEGGKGPLSKNIIKGMRRGTGRLKRNTISKGVSVGDTIGGTESEKEQDECQVLFERRPICSDSEVNEEGETSTKTSQPETSAEADKALAPAASLPSMPSTLEESPGEQVQFEVESATTSVEVMNVLQEGEEHGRDADQSPAIILEKILDSRQRATADKELCLMTARDNHSQGLDSLNAENEANECQEIKVEENISDPPLVAPTCENRQSASAQPQHHRDIRTVLVKEESNIVLNEAQVAQGSGHIRWNVEPVNTENTSSPYMNDICLSVMESLETTSDCRITPELSANQCIFYPVKEEDREVLLGAAAQTISGDLPAGTSSDTKRRENQATDSRLNEGSPSSSDQDMRVRRLLSEQGASVLANVEADAEGQHPADLQDFLLQSSDEEDVGGSELSDPQLDSEAEIMAYFYKNNTYSNRQPEEISQNLPTSANKPQAPREENRHKQPIDYFSKYFGWDTWVEIANCTKKLSNMPKPVTAKEVAQFVGVHIAMGTLKFPCPKLYWETLTKVPLIADAMPLSRFLLLCRMLKLASPAKDPVGSHVQSGRPHSDTQNAQQGETLSSRQSESCQHETHCSKTQTDPLWKARPLLSRFKAGCQSLRHEGAEYAVDQYPLPLTGKTHDKRLSLYCTTLIGFGGLLLHVDLKLGLSGKEDAVEKMVPKGSMVFLCKQELSTPAMLERLLVAGVHGAGRVGGARGQIGDEFVSSDGKLMLRRSHCGFILSTAGSGQRNMASLTDNFEKAQMSAHLNRDLQNLYSIPLTASAPTCWPQVVLWYLIDLALVNSWLLYRREYRAVPAPLTLMAFRLEVSKILILSSGSDTQDSAPPHPPKENAPATNETPHPSLVVESPLPDAATRYDGSGHWPEQLGEGEGGKCRFGDCQRTSRVLCLKCCVFLCISRNHNCFLNFHNQGSVGKD